jgi:OmpA-OmpF porin, OOP family
MFPTRSLLAALTLLVAGGATAQQNPKDTKGCADPQLFPTRVAGFHLTGCKTRDFDAVTFHSATPKAKGATVEGKVGEWSYEVDDRKNVSSDLAITRNYENAFTSLGGTVAERGASLLVGKVAKGDKEIWFELEPYHGVRYHLVVVEKQAMVQHVTADAAAFGKGLAAEGHAAVYGILFDTDQATLKPESAEALKEVAKLLAGQAALKLWVVGHTDSTGTPEHNMALSQARAEAVVQALVTSHGVAAARLRSQGCGQVAPVASNRTEEGRAKNRRVELVEQ